MDPLAGSPAANSTPATRICNVLFPGAFQLSVVVPTVAPMASVTGFAVKVTWLLEATVCTVIVEIGELVAGSTNEKFIPSPTQLPVAADPLAPTVANNDPFAKTCNEAHPGAFQLNVV